MKIHLLDSAEPLIEGKDYEAACRAPVKSVRFALAIDGEALDSASTLSSLSTLTTCGKCLRLELSKRYVYGICNGQEATHPEMEGTA